MSERPILFSGPMVRAILEGRKTQTRRVISDRNSQGNFRASELLLDDPRTFVDHGPSPAGNPGDYLHAHLDALKIEAARGWERGDCDQECVERLYPKWMPGDRLWVRETWQRYFEDEVPAGREHGPRDTMGVPAQPERKSFIYYRADGELIHPKLGRALWVTPLHMFRRMSRLTLEVKAVRVERLQEISEADARAEGIRLVTKDGTVNKFCVYDQGDYSSTPWSEMPRDAVSSYRSLWDSINAKRGHGWETNPWVWVVEFERVEGDR